jgi:hypothetical protein
MIKPSLLASFYPTLRLSLLVSAVMGVGICGAYGYNEGANANDVTAITIAHSFIVIFIDPLEFY